MHWLKIGFDVVYVASGYHGYEWIALFIVMQWLADLFVFAFGHFIIYLPLSFIEPHHQICTDDSLLVLLFT